MVKLRLRRRGRKKLPFYDIVAIDGRARRDGASIERVGYVNPMSSPKTVVIEPARAIYWLNVGAQPTDVVRSILSREGVLLRRSLEFKGKTPEEIDAAVEEHKIRSNERYSRLKQHRKDRDVARVKAKADAEAAESAAAESKAAAEAKAAEDAAAAEAKAAETAAAAEAKAAETAAAAEAETPEGGEESPAES